MTGISSSTIASYDRSAAEFADRTASFRPERALAAFADLVSPGSKVLDAGSGPGRDCRYLAQAGFVPTAYDLSQGMLAEGQRRGLIVSAVKGDLRRLPFASGSFQGVWASASLLHLSAADFVPALREIARVLGMATCTWH